MRYSSTLLNNSFIFAVCFTIGMDINNYFKYGKIDILLDIVFLFFSAWGLMFIILWFVHRKNKEFFQDTAGTAYYKGLARHYVGIKEISGYLIIAKDKIIFKSDSSNSQNYSTEIPFKDIIEVKPINYLGIIPTGLIVVQNGKIAEFVVMDRGKIVKILKDVIP